MGFLSTVLDETTQLQRAKSSTRFTSIMGCCHSSEAQAEQPGAAHPGPATMHPSSSTRHITPASTSSLSTDPRQSHPSLHHSRSNISSASQIRPITTRRQRNLTDHYSRPLRLHPWTSPPSRRWTSSQLAREREEFFETRVSGRHEIWEAIQGATQFMRAGDLETARAIVNAAGLIITNGDLVEGGYDQQGALYRVPEHIVQDPDNMLPEPDDSERRPPADGSAPSPEIENNIRATAEDDCGDAEGTATSTTADLVDKGKERERDSMRVRCRLSDREGADVIVRLGRSQTVATLKRRLYGEAGVDERKFRLRIVYLGRMLEETKTLEEQGWKEGQVVNTLVVENFAREQEQGQERRASQVSESDERRVSEPIDIRR